MSSLIAVSTVIGTAAKSRIAFTTDPTDWLRIITLDGKKAYIINSRCGTCGFLFERLEGAKGKVSPSEFSQRFRAGIKELDQDLLRKVATALPACVYSTLLLKCVPKRVRPFEPGDYFCEEQVALWDEEPHDTKTEYYRTNRVSMTNARGLFEFIVPMLPESFLDEDTVSSYKTALSGGAFPTALAISFLDVRQPAVWEGDPEINEHWCLAHYLLDGHHKMLAASELGLPISILSFLAVMKGHSSLEEVAEAIQVLAAPYHC